MLTCIASAEEFYPFTAALLPREAGCRVLDLGCGTGAIAMLMAAHCPGLHVDAVEIQPEIADMAKRSVELNDMGERMRVHEMDIE
jgi:tRNA1(Val) A37 N6-methylase TrmN6